MSNKLYDEIYNPEQKEMYLNGMQNTSRLANERVFKIASYLEKSTHKDLYDFNIDEIEKVVNLANPGTFDSSLDILSKIKTYITWAIQEGLRRDNINPLITMLDNNYIRKFIDKNKQEYFSKSDIDNMLSRIINYQDAVLVQAIFEGIMGKEYSEILNLKKNDVWNDSNDLTVHNSLGEGRIETRVVVISDSLLNRLQKAANEQTYIKNNGETSPNIKSSKDSELVDNEYIIRSPKLNTHAYGRAEKHLVTRRLTSISKWFGYSYLTATNVRKSGMIYEGYKLFKERGKFERDEVLLVCSKFNIATHGNTTRLERDFLNAEIIKEVYPELNNEGEE